MKKREYNLFYNAYSTIISVAWLLLPMLALRFILSFMATPFEQEEMYQLGGNTILGYNRDWLVNGRWWFALGFSVFGALLLDKLNRLSKLSKKL